MLKLRDVLNNISCCTAAAFGRLCVETARQNVLVWVILAAAFGRLCVETEMKGTLSPEGKKAAAFGRLCVETPKTLARKKKKGSSRLRAAVC